MRQVAAGATYVTAMASLSGGLFRVRMVGDCLDAPMERNDCSVTLHGSQVHENGLDEVYATMV